MPYNVLRLHGDAYGALFVRHCLECPNNSQRSDQAIEKVYQDTREAGTPLRTVHRVAYRPVGVALGVCQNLIT